MVLDKFLTSFYRSWRWPGDGPTNWAWLDKWRQCVICRHLRFEGVHALPLLHSLLISSLAAAEDAASVGQIRSCSLFSSFPERL
jgi:hypothetical protein